jgi:N-acetylglucosamine kinase-like BadF-type ATPase
MTAYFLGLDIGGSKTHALIADSAGQVIGFGQTGPGNHEVVGWDGLRTTLQTVTERALASGGLTRTQIAGAGFGVAGYDWPSQRTPTREAIESIGLNAPFEFVNDTVIGLIAGSRQGWGVGVVAGTSCPCWGRAKDGRQGQMTGGSTRMGEFGGGSEMVARAVQVVSQAWSKRGPETALSDAFCRLVGADDLTDLIEGLMLGRYHLQADAARTIVQVAEAGDPVAEGLVRWSGQELGNLAAGVIRQLDMADLALDIVLVGSLYNIGPRLIDPMRETVKAVAPQAHLIRLAAPPVAGGVMLAMEQAGLNPVPLRDRLIAEAARVVK